MIILSVISLGIYANGIDPSVVHIDDSSFQLTQLTEHSVDHNQLDLSDNFCFKTISTAVVNFNCRNTIVQRGFYQKNQHRILTQNIPTNSYRGSPRI